MFKIALPTPHFNLERWKFNKEYGVWVSNMGHFMDSHKHTIPPKIFKENGYVAVHTKCGDKMAHRIVMYTWAPIADREAFTVDHRDHNKRNNAVSNLEWITKEENLMRAGDDLVLCNAPSIKDASVPSTNAIYHNSEGISGTINEMFQWAINDNRTGAVKQITNETLKRFQEKVNKACAKGKPAYGVTWSFSATYNKNVVVDENGIQSLVNKNTNVKQEESEKKL